MLKIKDAAADFLANERVAVIGPSREPKSPGSNIVYKRPRDRGYEVSPVNPGTDGVEAGTCAADLGSIPDDVDAVVIATRPELAESMTHEWAGLGIEHVWMNRGPAADPGHKAMRVTFTLSGTVPSEV